jgi:hypothetical protein
MQQETNQSEGYLAPLKKVTPVSKYLAMALFIILPFIGGYIGYTFAPEKVVEKIVVKEVQVEAVEVVEKAEISELRIVKEVENSYVYLPNSAGSKTEYKIFDGEISNDSIFVSPDNNFLQFRGFPCSLRGGHCVGQLFVFDTTNKAYHAIEFSGDDNAPYNLEDDSSLAVWQAPVTSYGKIKNWDDQNYLIFEVDYKGTVYKYRSLSKDEPWVLGYLGASE